MTFSYQSTRRDVVDACSAMARKAYWYLLGLWLLLAIFLVWIARFGLLHGSTSMRIFLLLPLVICGLFFLLLVWLSPRIRARRVILREVSWTISDEGVQLASPVATSNLSWEAFLKYRETSKLFLLFVQKGMAQFIPKRMLTEEQVDDLRKLLASHIRAS